MQPNHRTVLLGAITLLLVSGCDFSSPWGSSSNGSEYGAGAVASNPGTGGGTGTGTGGSGPPGGVGGETGTNGSDNTVVATASVPGAVVAIGASQTVSITFTSSDGLAVTGFGVSDTLGTLPAGWSGPNAFTCASVATGSGCVLNLTYAPTAADSGTLVVNYIYVDNAGLSKVPGGSITIPYQAVPQNNVVATATPSGQINGVVGGSSQSVSVNFTTDTNTATTDDAATNLNVTNLGALPAGWTSTAASFSCAIVSSGSGCQLVLTYAPTAAGRGTLSLTYTYVDDSGVSRMGTLNIPYSNTVANTVVATASPTGQINAVEKTGGQAVAVTFTTDDGKPAANLTVTSNLAALPPGWKSSSKGFTCGSVSTGNGCQLPLTYAPTALASGTFTLNYAYDDDTGTAQTGTLNIPYAATTNDNVVATASPSGQINAVVGMGNQAVAVVFTTDDGRLATELQLTSNLTVLPAGWSSTAGSFACTSVSSGSTCQLNLAYAPAAAAAGTLTLNYSYKNNAGESKTGSLNILYRATTNDSIAGTPSQMSVAVPTGSSQGITVTFATDDGNPASALTVTSGLTSLPAGWTSTSMTFTCSTVSAGMVCQLPLTYAPTAAASGTLALGFSYVNDAGFANTGTVNIPYRATTNDNVVATPSQSPLAVVSPSSTIVNITFTTDDGNLASAMSITSGLTSLPAGWSSASNTFSCASVSTGTTCQLSLTYAPTGPDTGNVTLGFSYTDNAGTVKNGSVSVTYTAT